jgi:predicted glutamine amidotransferase
MCLLVSQPAGTVFDEAFLQGVYNHNSDGIGVMFADANGLNILRCVPTTYQEFRDFFKLNIEGKDCAWHARMRTHGDINLDNCHPYQVLSAADGYPLWMAHNGVLHTGNAANTKYSDTHHYIQDYLRPLLVLNPAMFMEPAFQELVASHIGTGNKFILMDAAGNQVVLNRSSGVMYNGAWLSNTYAWDTTNTLFERKSYKSASRWPGHGLYDEDDWDNYFAKPASFEKRTLEDEENPDSIADDCVDFICEFFDAATKQRIDLDDLSYEEAEIYYHNAGGNLAWELVENIEFGAHTRDSILFEFEGYVDLNSADYEEESIFVSQLKARPALEHNKAVV